MANHCKALTAHGQANYVEAYEAVVTTMTLFLKVFRAAESPWVMAPLYALVFNLRAAAERADDDLRRQNKPLCKLSDAGSQLMRCFRECLTVRAYGMQHYDCTHPARSGSTADVMWSSCGWVHVSVRLPGVVEHAVPPGGGGGRCNRARGIRARRGLRCS
jgi:hypothetical protein